MCACVPGLPRGGRRVSYILAVERHVIWTRHQQREANMATDPVYKVKAPDKL